MLKVGDQVIAPDRFAGEIISEQHGGASAYTYGSTTTELNLMIASVMSKSGEIRRYRLDVLTEVAG